MLLFRARQFPQYYHLGFDDPANNGELANEPAAINIYTIDLPNINSLSLPTDYGKHINTLTKSELKDIDKKNDIPYIIVNPFEQNETKFCIMDHLMIATVPKNDK